MTGGRGQDGSEGLGLASAGCVEQDGEVAFQRSLQARTPDAGSRPTHARGHGEEPEAWADLSRRSAAPAPAQTPAHTLACTFFQHLSRSFVQDSCPQAVLAARQALTK